MPEIDPYLEHLIVDQDSTLRPKIPKRKSLVRVAEFANPMAAKTLTMVAPTKEVKYIPVLIKLADQSFDMKTIKGCQVTSQIGSVVACRCTPTAIAHLRNNPSIEEIEAGREGCHVELANSLKLVKANLVHEHKDYPEKGDQAIIAFFDDGIDVLHEAFTNENGETRILAIWDQTDDSGKPPPEFNYGTLHEREQINQYLKEMKVPKDLGRNDPNEYEGHGTHVASIAAGRQTKGNCAGGIAPAAQIVMVKVTGDPQNDEVFSSGFTNNYVDALRFVKNLADHVALPVVLNLSLGWNYGGHDGNTVLETAFDNMTNMGRSPGFVIVKSAGNEGETARHARFAISDPNPFCLELTVEPKGHLHGDPVADAGPYIGSIWFKNWHDLSFAIQAPDDPATPQDWMRWTDSLTTKTWKGSDNTARLTYKRYSTTTSDSTLILELKSPTAVAAGVWKIWIKPNIFLTNIEIDSWIERDPYFSLRFAQHVSANTTLTIPGTAHSVLTVGAIGSTPPDIQFCPISSQGPTRDGRFKPEVVAPGVSIWAAKATTANDFVAFNGTSMAAPHVSGAIALLLSHWQKQKQNWPNPAANPWRQLNASEVISAVTKLTTPQYQPWDNLFGFGMIDVEKLLKAFTIK